jgi:threonine dehydratase
MRADVEAARVAIGGRLHRTPTFTSATLSSSSGADVHLKAELFQRTGSFKIRGVLNKLASLTATERGRGVIGVSAGNHAQALAYGAAVEGLDCLLVMWRTASEAKIAATLGYGAEVDLEAEGPSVVFERLQALLDETGRTLVHPFEDPLVAAGQGTVALELEEDVAGLETIVVPVGGGGLLTGVVGAFPGRIVAVEPESSQALHAGLAAGHSVPVEPGSVADGLNAPFAGRLALEACASRPVETVLVTEEEIGAGMRFLYERAKLACEPAGAAATAAVLAGKVELGAGEVTALIVSGGNVAAQTASGILALR